MNGRRQILAPILLAAALAPARLLASEPPRTTPLFKISTMTGVLRYSGARLAFDRVHKELYVFADGQIHVFNDAGMEIYAFGDSPEMGGISGLGVLDDGDMITLSHFERRWTLLRCNFRGEKLNEIPLVGVPPEHLDFEPSTMKYMNGMVYLANLNEMTFMIVDTSGKYVTFIDTLPLVEPDPEKQKRDELGIKNFSLDKDGNILFVIQPMFRAFFLTPSGQIKSWGRAGSAPGKFNIVSAIASDDDGNLYVTDMLKSAIIVFDKDFRFLREFGYRGSGPQNVTTPLDIAIGDDKIWVSQLAKQGVSVFQIKHGGEDDAEGQSNQPFRRRGPRF